MNINFENQLDQRGPVRQEVTSDIYLNILNKIYAQIRYDCY